MAFCKLNILALAAVVFFQTVASQEQVPNCTAIVFTYYSRFNPSSTFVQERKVEDVYVNITLREDVTEANFTLYPPDNSYKMWANDTIYVTEGMLGSSRTFTHWFKVKGIKLGVAQVYMRGTYTSTTEGVVIIDQELIEDGDFECYRTGHLIKVMVWAPPYKELVDWFLIAWVSITYVSMGVKIDLNLVWGRLKRPWPVFIGFLCQFILMPVTAFTLAFVLQLNTYEAIGLVVDGAAPGGWTSNILAILLNLDFILSLTMTTCSTLLAIGTMPFNLWLYGRPFLNEELGVVTLPFQILIMQLGLLLIPVILGMLIGRFLPKIGKYVEKALKPLALALIVLSIGLGIPVKFYAFLASWQVYLAGITLPIIGGSLGFLISMISRLSVKKSLTVALETGLQNALLATTMLALAFRPPEKDLMARVPLLISLLSGWMCFLVVLIKMAYEKITGKKFGGKYLEDDADDEEKKDEANLEINDTYDKDVEMTETKDNKGFEAEKEENHMYDASDIPNGTADTKAYHTDHAVVGVPAAAGSGLKKVAVWDGHTMSTQTMNVNTGRLHTLDQPYK